MNNYNDDYDEDFEMLEQVFKPEIVKELPAGIKNRTESNDNNDPHQEIGIVIRPENAERFLSDVGNKLPQTSPVTGQQIPYKDIGMALGAVGVGILGVGLFLMMMESQKEKNE